MQYISVSIVLFLVMLAVAKSFRTPAKSFNTMRRLMSIKGGSLPADDAMKPFYVLGVNIALQGTHPHLLSHPIFMVVALHTRTHTKSNSW